MKLYFAVGVFVCFNALLDNTKVNSYSIDRNLPISAVSSSPNSYVASGCVSRSSSALFVASSSLTATANELENEMEEVEFPPPLTSLQRTKRAIEFYKRVLPVLAAYKAKEVELKLFPSSERNEEEIWAELDEWGSGQIADTIQEMKGFYVKTGQVISTRVDLFPDAYTSKLQELQDGLDPMPFALVEKVVRQELLDGAPLSELFASFDEEPLGAASIAQVHKATLLDGRVVAVKLQRPNVEPKLLGDVANLKRISKALAKSLPVDYYTVFCELGDALERELDFLSEAQAMRKLHMSLTSTGVRIPLPVGELVSKRVLVMDFVEGVPLNRLQQTLKEKGIEAGSVEAKLAGRRILESLADAFGVMIFEAGAIHGDPHPGNIFIGEGAKVSLIDCGQFKSLPRPQRLKLAKLVSAASQYQTQRRLVDSSNHPSLKLFKDKLAKEVRTFGLQFSDELNDDDDLACSVALFLFGDSDLDLPGGYSTNEFDDNSPIKLVKTFPQELVLLGRAAVLMKGIAKRLDVPFSLGDRWDEDCKRTMTQSHQPILPIWGKTTTATSTGSSDATAANDPINGKISLRQVTRLFKDWGKGKGQRFTQRIIKNLPPKLRTRVLEYILKRKEMREK